MNLKIFILIYFSIIHFGCTNYDGERYISYENEVIKEIIPELLSLENYQIPDLENVTIFLINELGSKISIDTIYDIEYESISENTLQLMRREISYKTLEEIELFKSFIKGRIKGRKLNIDINHQFLNIKNIGLKDFMNRDLLEKPENIFDESISIVYLFLTRISFDKNKEYGYLNYTVFCGEACFWTKNIEIKKDNNKWLISRLFSGGIA